MTPFPMSEQKIRFAAKDVSGFIPEVKAEVNRYFKETGKSKHANWRMVRNSVVVLLMTWGSYALIMTGWFTPMQMLMLAILMGIGAAGVGFGVAHDALHGSYTSNDTINKLLGYTFDLLGANGYMWKITHNVIHHTYTNIPGVDEDLDVSPLVRLSPESPRYSFHRFQQFFAFPAYSLATINWLFAKDFQQFMKRDIGPYKDKRHPMSEIVTLIVTKAFVVFYMIVLPLMVLDLAWWQFLIGFMAMHMTAGLILGVIFQLAHVVEGTEYLGPDDDGNMEHAWLIHEMRTTSNFAHSNKLLQAYIGGLNYQIEHHLFPQVCSIHYPEIGKIVREVAARYDIPYHYHPTLRAAIRSHLHMLKELGQPVAA